MCVPVMERMEKKVVTWKRRCPSLGGWITFIGVALKNLPVYYLSLFKMLFVAKSVGKLQHDLFWDRRDEKERWIHYMNWQEVSKPKQKGGLGSGKITERNWALSWVNGGRF